MVTKSEDTIVSACLRGHIEIVAALSGSLEELQIKILEYLKYLKALPDHRTAFYVPTIVLGTPVMLLRPF